MPRYNYKYGTGADDVYCYPNSTVLKNLYNIRDEEKLADIENKIISVKLLNLKRVAQINAV